MVKLRQYFGKIAAYVGHLSQISIDADKDWKGKEISNVKLSGITNTLDLDTTLSPKIKIPTGRYLYGDNSGTDIFHADDTEKALAGILTKEKEIKLNKTPDTSLKIYFEMGGYSGGFGNTLYAQIYKNGIAVGTLFSQSQGVTETYTPRTETISGWNDGDLLQLYGYYSAGGGYYAVKNLRILSAEKEEVLVNQDP